MIVDNKEEAINTEVQVKTCNEYQSGMTITSDAFSYLFITNLITYKQLFNLYMYVELENDDLSIILEQLSATWNNDKATDKYLTEEKLIPLMELDQMGDTKSYFECVNEELEKLITNESIFELMDVDSETKDNETSDRNGKLNFNNQENSAVSYLINSVKQSSSAEVSY